MVDSTNPRVMADNIKMLAAAGGGTTVEANPEGAATAELEKLGVGDAIYSIPALEYSATEKVIGKWTDGEDLYEKVISFGALPDTNTKKVSHGVTSPGVIWVESGFVYNSELSIYFQLNRTTNTLNYQWETSIDATDVIIQDFADFSSFTATVIIRYTKATTP